ncbi:hypothetical protein [Achromobacter xylosoxidans]|uniref:hypothetical protein n=1 Tax=Alcaligenes xylosoxydans xylosoxydans TaxID=85698 RepID=UPI00117850A0|nr:hypothetical protein [Achromobacter xylosoxidans]
MVDNVVPGLAGIGRESNLRRRRLGLNGQPIRIIHIVVRLMTGGTVTFLPRLPYYLGPSLILPRIGPTLRHRLR